ncbi:hypothetical protein PMAYCL1PPCAC_05838, partial [Pristionchus mayeri]
VMSGRLLTSARDFVVDARKARFVLLPVLFCINLTKDLMTSIHGAKKANKKHVSDGYNADAITFLFNTLAMLRAPV